jgi:hypothetical protein
LTLEQLNVVKVGVVWCGVVWCGVVWCGVVWCGVVWCGVVWCGGVACGGVGCELVAWCYCCWFLLVLLCCCCCFWLHCYWVGMRLCDAAVFVLVARIVPVVQVDHVWVNHVADEITVNFTPTVPHCSMATLIGLSLRVKLLRSLPPRFKVG